MTLVCDVCGYEEIVDDEYQELRSGDQVFFACTKCILKSNDEKVAGIQRNHSSAIVKEQALRKRHNTPIIISKEVRRLSWWKRLITGLDEVTVMEFEYEHNIVVHKVARKTVSIKEGCQYGRYSKRNNGKN